MGVLGQDKSESIIDRPSQGDDLGNARKHQEDSRQVGKRGKAKKALVLVFFCRLPPHPPYSLHFALATPSGKYDTFRSMSNLLCQAAQGYNTNCSFGFSGV